MGTAAALAANKERMRADNAAVRATFQEIVNAARACRSPLRQSKAEECFARISIVDFDSALAGIWNELDQKQSDSKGLAAGLALNAFLAEVFDPHTYFSPTRSMEDRQKPTDEFVGIGVTVHKVGNHLVIAAPLEGGPAHLAGIRQGDVILKIDGKARVVTEENFDSMINRLRGRTDSVVKLQIKRGEKTLNISVARKPVKIDNVSSKLLSDKGHKFGYIRLGGFNPESCSQIKTKLDALKKENIEGLVFDLRGNGGGSLDEAICIGGLFVGKETIVQVQTLGSTQFDKKVSSQDQVTQVPMVTLIDSGSASASEIVSGALQDHQRSWIAGDRSFGKGSVQGVDDISQFLGGIPIIDEIFKSDAAARKKATKSKLLLALTIQRFFQPSGRTNQSVGISPDFALDPFPGATADDKIAVREEDLYVNALSRLGEPWVQPRPQEVAKVETCMKQTGVAESLFTLKKNDAIPADYQILKAQDILTCATH
jgi:carboxyl-terminal processing protease